MLIRHIKNNFDSENEYDKEKIISLFPHITGHLLSLGIIPYGTVCNKEGRVEEHLISYLEGVKLVGEDKKLHVEKIKELSPALVIGNAKKQLIFFEELKEIAPLVLLKDLKQDWKEIFKFIASLLKMEEKAEAVLKEFEENLKKYSETEFVKLKNKTVLVIDVHKTHELKVYSSESPLGEIFYKNFEAVYPENIKVENKYIGYKTVFPLLIEESKNLSIDYVIILGLKDEKAFDTLEKYKKICPNLFSKTKVFSFSSLKEGSDSKGILFYKALFEDLVKNLDKIGEIIG